MRCGEDPARLSCIFESCAMHFQKIVVSAEVCGWKFCVNKTRSGQNSHEDQDVLGRARHPGFCVFNPGSAPACFSGSGACRVDLDSNLSYIAVVFFSCALSENCSLTISRPLLPICRERSGSRSNDNTCSV